ncbi:MFS transporter [Phytoactinopolyspora halotolerans]|uniref:MFS transporter n=1 Tax=Phytoactinopolyspora halotolerans TaxID=1981512 RepID=A0A6L9SGJ2_9ACTN|nr:MFS transporter [Phytoactinopolyspora halotolerans]NEE04495.1 MFS transporter [Phytoactinopolyspora halotolerans]
MSHALAETQTRTVAAPSRRITRNLVLAMACAAIAMVSIDIAIVNVALPSIQAEFGVGHGMLQWVVVAYSLLLGGFLLFGGRLADRLGQRRVFIIGLATFTGASFLAGVAQQADVLIAARTVQGFGAALIAPTALSLIAVTFTEGPERERALGIFGAVGGIAASAGVVASGLLTAGPGWRWAFYINVPTGLMLILLGAAFAPGRTGDRKTRLDIAGAITVTGSLLLFIYALHHAAGHSWLSGSTLALFAAAAILMVAFVRIEARAKAPLVPAATLRNRSLISSNLTAFLASCAFLAFIFIGSLLMQQALGYSPIDTGLAWLATTATIFPVAIIGGRLVAKVGLRRLLITGLVLFAAAALWLARVPSDGSYVTDVLPAFVLAGIGFGLVEPALQIGALTGVAEEDTGLASGLIETMREVGGAAGVAGVSTVLVAGSGIGGFHTAFLIMAALLVLGMISASLGHTRRA